MNKMKFSAFRKIGQILAVGVLVLSVASCDKKVDPADPKDPETETPTFDVDAKEYFNIAFTTRPTDGPKEFYVSAHTNVTTGTINHTVGFEVPSTRTTYMFGSQDGRAMYSLNYGGGLIYKWDVEGHQEYVPTGVKSFSLKMGSEHAKWGELSDKWASLHIVPSAEKIYDGDKLIQIKAMARIIPIDLSDELSFGETADFEFPRSQDDIDNNRYVGNLMWPILHEGKAYYAVSKGRFDPLTGDDVDDDELSKFHSTTLIVDFPSLENPKMISSTVATGSASGNAPTTHVYDGSIYQLSGHYSDPCLLKITDGEYDNTYNLNIAKMLGFESVGAEGWFYAGNGIGYMPYYTNINDEETWGLARLDVKTGTAIIMNLEGKLDLGLCQSAKLSEDGKLYMPIVPKGEDGNVYIFDPTKADKNAFTKGATLTTVAGVAYVGVF